MKNITNKIIPETKKLYKVVVVPTVLYDADSGKADAN